MPPPKKARTTDRPLSPSILLFPSSPVRAQGCASVPAFETNLSQQGPPIGPVFNAWPVPFFWERPSETGISHSPPFLDHTLTNHDALVPLAGAGGGRKIAVQKAPDTTASSVAQTDCRGHVSSEINRGSLRCSRFFPCRILPPRSFFFCRVVAESSEQRTTHSKTKVSPVPNTIP